MNEDNKNGTVTTLPSGETTTTTTETPTETKSQTGTPENIDFKKVADELEKQTPPSQTKKRTPQEEAAYNLKKNLERAKELGVDVEEVIGTKKSETSPVDTSNFVTKLDLARDEARKLAKSEDELKVIMWHVEHRGLSVEDSWFLANKPRFKNTLSEIQRGNVKPPQGAGESSGQKPPITLNPERHPNHETLIRRGYKLIKPGLYQAKHYQEVFNENSKTWVSEKIQK